MKELFRNVAVNESMTYRIWLAAVGTVRVTRYSKEVKFFFGDKYPMSEFEVKFFKFVLFAHIFNLLKVVFPVNGDHTWLPEINSNYYT